MKATIRHVGARTNATPGPTECMLINLSATGVREHRRVASHDVLPKYVETARSRNRYWHNALARLAIG
jgi:hypothetical protein